MKTTPVTDDCQKSFDARGHVCFGISPFNSYFSESRIQSLAEWGRQEFREMHFFVPDVPSIYTLEALGYAPDKAEWKARRQSQYLFNKIQRALINLGYSHLDVDRMILNWEKLLANHVYMELYAKIKKQFETDSRFQYECIQASRWVLEKRVSDEDSFTEPALRSAARYLLAEIPIFINTADILDLPASSFCYHQCIPFIENLMKGHFEIQRSSKQGFVVIE